MLEAVDKTLIDEVLSYGRLVEEHFHADHEFWDDVYTQASLAGEVYRARRGAVLQFVDGLNLASGSRVLDVGCGAGSITLSVAARGLVVDAVDPVREMRELTSRAADTVELNDRVRVSRGEVNRLDFPDGTFHCAIVIGVMEWMLSYAGPLRELHRVLAPDGWLITNIDNAGALHCLFDPRMVPMMAPLKRTAVECAQRAGLFKQTAHSSRCSPRRFQAALDLAGFDCVETSTTGFGPFTILGMPLLPESAGIRLHRYLQGRAAAGSSLLRKRGDAHIVLARKRSLAC